MYLEDDNHFNNQIATRRENHQYTGQLEPKRKLKERNETISPQE